MKGKQTVREHVLVMIGLGIMIGAGMAPGRTHGAPSFVDTSGSHEQGAAVNSGMSDYHPNVLAITFSAPPPPEPLAEEPQSSMLAEPQAPEAHPDELFALRTPSGEQPQPQAPSEVPAVTDPAVSAIPEPSSLMLLLSGVTGVVGYRYWRRRRSRRQ